MNRTRRLCFTLLLGMIPLTLASQMLANEDSNKETATKVRDDARRNYRANYATLKGVQCKVTQTITMDLNLLSHQDTGVMTSGDTGIDERENSDSPVLLKRVRPLRRLTPVVDTVPGIRQRTTEHRVFFSGLRVRNESIVDERVESRHIRNGMECSYETDAISNGFGTSWISRGRIDDPQFRDGPIVDPRDFGASSGFGRLEEMLSTWDEVTAINGVAKCGRSGLMMIKLREPLAVDQNHDLANESVLYLDPEKNLLPVMVEHFQQRRLLEVVEINYTRCDWRPATCYLPTEAVYVMPADSKQTTYESLTEIKAHSRRKFVVTEASTFEPADNDKTFRLRSSTVTRSNQLESTFITAPIN